uniref:uncharacterized protein LOC100181965 isoform X2 n=1 Tax=Ciona intestinalis TaxID=7719 RepID=UPI000EF4D567|nr:uncharacterized protein LOC100181965 isoform X2 [Ciona intestinalis]|eukprot:XP_026693281.1 uncharacterized protein LOC100181965 isoform X2 [Ciona intestinalis]
MNSKGENYIDSTILETFHDECFQKAMQQYEEHDVFEPDESEKQCQILKTRLNGCYLIIQQNNEARKVREQNIIMDKVGVAGNVYFEEMEKVADGQHLEDAITAKAEAERKANEAFKTSTSDCNQDLVKKCENKLHEAIQLKHREFERINANRLEICVELKRTINEYLAQFEKVENKYVEDEYLHQIHESSKQQALQTYANNENSVSPEARESFSENMDKLKNEMEQIFIFKTDMNKNNKEKVERIIQLFYAEVSVEYLETMKEVAKYGEPMLIKVHEIYKKYISEKVKQEIPISTLRESTKEECDQMLDELREKVEAHWTTWLIYVAVGATVLAAAGTLLACIGFAAAGVVAAEGTAVGGAISAALGGTALALNTSATIMLNIERFFSRKMGKNIKDSPSFTTLQEVRPFFIN